MVTITSSQTVRTPRRIATAQAAQHCTNETPRPQSIEVNPPRPRLLVVLLRALAGLSA